MKSTNKAKKENGAIMLIAVFASTILILLAAMVIDYGLFYYNGAKLQNAVDSAATAVASELGSTSRDMEVVARKYLDKNGFSSESNEMDVKIETKGVLDEETVNEDVYISSGYIKLTVTVTKSDMFSAMFNPEGMTLRKTAFVKAKANYVDMPRALRYTLFAASTKGTPNNAAMTIDGRTGDIVNMINSVFNSFLNDVNASIIQPIIGWFGGNPDFTDLLHMNLSEAITDGDVHSNSNINIGVQAVNASRVKDGNLAEYVKDENGNPIQETDSNGNPLFDEDGNPIYKTSTVEIERGDADFDDYGQVTYTATGPIRFTNSSGNENTHIYVQNQQYLEQTQATLGILNLIDYSNVNSYAGLKDAYHEAAKSYFNSRLLTEDQKAAIINQVENNISYNNGSVNIENQSMIVYDVSRDDGNAMLDIAGEQGLDGLYEDLRAKGPDKLYKDDGSAYYDRVADKFENGGINYDVDISHSNPSGDTTDGAAVNINGNRINRDYELTRSSVIGDTNYDENSTAVGAKFAISRTFQQNLGSDGYISTPNMRPYFIRQVNQSIRNATKTKEELGDSQAAGAKTVKEAVKNMSDDLVEILENTSYEDATYKDENFSDSKELLFSRYKASAESGLAPLTGGAHTSFKGQDLYKAGGEFKLPTDFSKDFESKNLTVDADGEGKYGKGAIKKFYNDKILDNDADAYETNYANDAVAQKRAQLEGGKFVNADYNSKYNEVKSQNFVAKAPSVLDVFLGETNVNKPRSEFNNAVADIDNKNIKLAFIPARLGQTITLVDGQRFNDGSLSRTFTDSRGSGGVNLSGGFYGSGNWTKGKDQYVSSDSAAVVVGNIDSVNGAFSEGGNIDVGTASGGNAKLIVYGNLYANGDLQVRTGSTLYVDGNIDCWMLDIDEGAKVYCTGNIKITKLYNDQGITSKVVAGSITLDDGANTEIINYGTLCTAGDFVCQSELTNNGTVKCMGNMVINGVWKNGAKYRYSLYNYGGSKIYVKGNMSTTYGGEFDASTMFVCGNYYAGNVGETANMIAIKGTTRIYIRGTASCGNTGSHIYFENNGEGSTLSVFGAGTTNNCFNNSVGELCNRQRNSNIYLGTGIAEASKFADSRYMLNFGSSATFENQGSLYVYTNLQIGSANAVLNGPGKTYIAGVFNAPSANIQVTEGHTLEADGLITCATATAKTDTAGVQGSKIIALYGLNTSSFVINSVEADKQSEIFCGPNHTTYGTLSIDINGQLFIPKFEDTLNLSKLNLGKFALFAFAGSSLNVSNWFYVEQGAILYVKGKTTVSNCMITSYGAMYLMGGLDMTNSNCPANDCDIRLGDASDTFIGSTSGDPSVIGTLNYKGYFIGKGNLYIENNVQVNGYSETASEYVANRYESFIVSSGNTYISGDVNTALVKPYRAMYVGKGCSLSCRNMTVGSSVYNLGKYIILDNFNFDNSSEYSDKKELDRLKEGYSIRNGIDDSANKDNVIMYLGGSNVLTIGGGLENRGTFIKDGGINVRGYSYASYGATQTDTAFVNRNGAVAHIGGPVKANNNGIFNGVNSVFSCVGDCEYGLCLYNCGEFIATGDITCNNQADSVNGVRGADAKSFSLRNGAFEISTNLDDSTFPNSVIYCGGKLQLGKAEHGDDANAGSILNFGTCYVKDDLLVYTNAKRSYYTTAMWMFTNSNTYVGGKVFAGGGVAIGNNTIFMCEKSMQTKRSLKINVHCTVFDLPADGKVYSYTDKDQFSTCYFYCGGNLLANTLGKSVRSSSIYVLPENCSRDMDVYSNANIYIGGSYYANCKLYLKQNVTMIVEGKTRLNSKNTYDEIINSIENGTVRATIQGLLDGTDYSAFIYQCLDENVCTRLVVNGSMFVRDTAKIRDMSKTYIYGSFKCNDYVEIGKALDGADETEAKEDLFKAEGETEGKYKFSNAAYMYVDGNFKSYGYTRLYASTTLRTKGQFETSNFLSLRHDAKIFVGKLLRASTSIDGYSYSQFYVNGTMRATLGYINLRDRVTAVIGGNMTAFSYIELGQAGDYVRGEDVGDIGEGSEGSYGGEEGEKDGNSDGLDETKPGHEEDIKDESTIDTEKELASDSSDEAKGGYFYIGKMMATYTSYIKEYAYSRVAVGNFVFAPNYITLRHNSDMWVMPEVFDEATYVYHPYEDQSDGTLWGDIVNELKKIGYEINEALTPDNGSIYSMGELTLNKNSSLMGTYDAIIRGQCVLRQDSLIYMGHDFNLYAPSVNINWDSLTGKTSVVGFDSYGTASGSSVKTTFPVVVYADNEINIMTTVDMKLTYLVANKGDVRLYDLYSNSENADNNAKQLPNAVCSYRGDINYFAMYGKIGALFYCPNGNLDLDGYYMEIWGCGIGDTVSIDTYYLALHRFTNWRTMQLNIAEAGSVHLISQTEYEEASDDVDDMNVFDRDNPDGDGSLFFDKDPLPDTP